MPGQSHVYVGVARWTGGTLGGVFRQEVGGTHWERMGAGMPEDAQVQALAVHPDEPDVVFAGAADGLYRSLNRGRRWERVGMDDRAAQVWSIAFDPQRPQRMFAGCSPVAVWRSEDGGESWRPLPAPKLPERVKMPFPCRVMRIAVDPRDRDRIYAALEVGGAVRSLDGGETWEDCNDSLIAFAQRPEFKSRILSDSEDEGMLDGHAICISPAEPDALVLALRMGLFRSEDGGRTWRDMEIGRFSPLTYSRDVRVAPHDPRTLYACLSPAARSEAGSIYRSLDLGRTWSRFDHTVRANSTMMAVAPHPREPDVVFAVSRLGQAFTTADGGATWRESRLPDGCADVYAAACG